MKMLWSSAISRTREAPEFWKVEVSVCCCLCGDPDTAASVANTLLRLTRMPIYQAGMD